MYKEVKKKLKKHLTTQTRNVKFQMSGGEFSNQSSIKQHDLSYYY